MSQFVSVIVPVFNNPAGIAKLINALLGQSLPKERFEIIIVDNGSTDNTLSVVESYTQKYSDRIRVFSEVSIKSSYAARNKGLAEACGEVIAFTDSDCVPSPGWLEEGLNTLVTENAHLAGGKITFFLSDRQTPAEVYDAVKNLRMEYYIQEKKAAPTANLFVRRSIFHETGPFDATLKSGGDFKWTRQATLDGFTLIYSEKAEVLHPARTWGELVNKQYRIGKGIVPAWKIQGKNWFAIFTSFLAGFLPNKPKTVRKWINDNGRPEWNQKFWLVWGIAWLSNVVTSFGIIGSFFSNPRH